MESVRYIHIYIRCLERLNSHHLPDMLGAFFANKKLDMMLSVISSFILFWTREKKR
jgi:hypothetical protein